MAEPTTGYGTMRVDFGNLRKKLARQYDSVMNTIREANDRKRNDMLTYRTAEELAEQEALADEMDELRSLIGAVLAIEPEVDIVLQQVRED